MRKLNKVFPLCSSCKWRDFSILTSFIVSIHFFIPRDQFWILWIFYSLAYLVFLLPQNQSLSGNFYILTGIYMRVPLLFSLPTLSEDYLRYLWDSYAIFQAYPPYQYTPNQLHELYQQSGILLPNWLSFVFQNLNSRDFYSFYPPIHQWFSFIPFFVSYSIWKVFHINIILFYVFIQKIILFFIEIGNLYLLKKLLKFREKNLKYYAWNPLVVLEGVGNLHYEVLMLFFLASFFYGKNWFLKSLFLCFSVATKILTVILLPRFLRQWRMVFPSLLFLFIYISYLNIPHQISKGFGLYIHSFEFFSFLNYYLRLGISLLGFDFQRIGWIPWLVVGIFIFIYTIYSYNQKKISPEKFFFVSLSMVFLMSPILHPWYLIPWLAVGILLGYTFPLVGCFLIYSSYSYYMTYPYQRNEIIVVVSYLFFFLYLGWEFYEHKYRRNCSRYSSCLFRNFP